MISKSLYGFSLRTKLMVITLFLFAVKHVSQFSLLSASSTHQIAASIHQQNKAMDEISSSSEMLNSYSKE